MVGLGTPREIPAGVVDGNYFEVVGLKPVLGRLLTPADDGRNAAGAVVLTYGFWRNSLHSDPSVLGKTVRLEGGEGARSATVVGVLEPSVPYPVATEIIANVVTSPHHLSATMVTGRSHRMTEVFARLAPGATLEQARAELDKAYASMTAAHPESYKPGDHFQISVTRLHDQINAQAKAILWILFAASGLLFVIASSNVANLVLARTVRRESELAVRSALGASTATLRRSLLAEESGAERKRSHRGDPHCGADGLSAGQLRGAVQRAGERSDARLHLGLVRNRPRAGGGGISGVHSAASFIQCAAGRSHGPRHPGCRGKRAEAPGVCGYPDHSFVPAAGRSVRADEGAVCSGADAPAV